VAPSIGGRAADPNRLVVGANGAVRIHRRPWFRWARLGPGPWRFDGAWRQPGDQAVSGFELRFSFWIRASLDSAPAELWGDRIPGGTARAEKEHPCQRRGRPSSESCSWASPAPLPCQHVPIVRRAWSRGPRLGQPATRGKPPENRVLVIKEGAQRPVAGASPSGCGHGANLSFPGFIGAPMGGRLFGRSKPTTSSALHQKRFGPARRGPFAMLTQIPR